LLRRTASSDGVGGVALGIFAESLEPFAPDAARPALRWLRARAAEIRGDITAAEAGYGAAESLDPSWPLPLRDLARYASDRGDAPRALSLLRRAAVPADDGLVVLLEQFRAEPRRDLGRNQPCWCGSGRKYKQCHLHREQLPLADRASWLYQKAALPLSEGPYAGTLVDAAEIRGEFSDTPEPLLEALQDPLVPDVVLFEGGAFAEFLVARGALLPADERSLAAQWLLTERSVFEVRSVRRGESITVRDVRTGDVHEVRERTASRTLRHGNLFCARIVPAGDTMQIFGGLEPIKLHQRDELVELLDTEPDPSELVAFLTRRFAPPSVVNVEGEPLLMCEATFQVPDPAGLAEKLDAFYLRRIDDDEDDQERPRPPDELSAEWIEPIEIDGQRRRRAELYLLDRQLSVHANSARRLDRVGTVLRELEPALVLIGESRESPTKDVQTVIDRVSRSTTRDRDFGRAVDSTSPEIAAALRQFTLDYERTWLDESIPALDGHSPRECATDPTRRADLILLLDSFPPDTGKPGTMSADRLRAALDLA
jgi:hypothetical protein